MWVEKKIFISPNYTYNFIVIPQLYRINSAIYSRPKTFATKISVIKICYMNFHIYCLIVWPAQVWGSCFPRLWCVFYIYNGIKVILVSTLWSFCKQSLSVSDSHCKQIIKPISAFIISTVAHYYHGGGVSNIYI